MSGPDLPPVTLHGLDRNRCSLNWWASGAPGRRGYSELARRQMVRFFSMSLPTTIQATRHGLREVLR